MARFRHALIIFVGGAALTSFCSIAGADFVNELEDDGTAVNNSLTTAQALAPISFTPNMDSNVFGLGITASVMGAAGGNDVDFYSFQSGPGAAYFDIDGTSGLDSYIALFDANGTLLADNDDSFPADPGSSTDLDSFLGTFILPATGTYYIAVSNAGNFANATFTGSGFSELMRPDGEFGGFSFDDADFGDSSFAFNDVQGGLGYTLHITIPAPGALALFGVAGMFGRRRRRSDSK